MDVLQRLMPRTGAGNGVQFKRLKHHSQCSATPLSEESPVWLNPNNGDHPNSTTDQDQLALIPATNSPRVELGLVLNNNNGQGNREEHNGKKEGGGKPRGWTESFIDWCKFCKVQKIGKGVWQQGQHCQKWGKQHRDREGQDRRKTLNCGIFSGKTEGTTKHFHFRTKIELWTRGRI